MTFGLSSKRPFTAISVLRRMLNNFLLLVRFCRLLSEAQVVCVGQLAGDLNADPAVIPCLAKGISGGKFVDLALAFSRGAGTAPAATCRFSFEGGAGTHRDFLVGCPNALAASDACFITDRWFTPHFSVLARFRIDAWMADVACPVVCQLVWPAFWLDTPDRSSSSTTRVVQDVWDAHRKELGVFPADVVLALGEAASRSFVDDFWFTWSRHAEAGLFRAYSRAGGPTEAFSAAFLGRCLLRIRSRRLGGRAVGGSGSGRLYRASQSDEVDVHCAQFFVISSLAPIAVGSTCGTPSDTPSSPLLAVCIGLSSFMFGHQNLSSTPSQLLWNPRTIISSDCWRCGQNSGRNFTLHCHLDRFSDCPNRLSWCSSVLVSGAKSVT